MVLILLAFIMIGCSNSGGTNPFDVANNDSSDVFSDDSDDTSDASDAGILALLGQPLLFGVAHNEELPEDLVKSDVTVDVDGSGTSSLYVINQLTGNAILIGDIGYRVTGIAFDITTMKLYGIALIPNPNSLVKRYTYVSQLIEINTITGEGTPIGPSTGKLNNGLTFNSSGTLFSWNVTDNALCTINLTTGQASSFSSSGWGKYQYGLAFNNSDVLYLIYFYNNGSNHSAVVGKISTTTGAGTNMGEYQFSDYISAYNGDFHPLTGQYWGIDDDNSSLTVLSVDDNSVTLKNTIPTISNLESVTFGWMNPFDVNYNATE